MFPNWLLPPFDPRLKSLPSSVRTNSIKLDWERDERLRLKKEATKERHKEWQALAEGGMKRFAIAKMYGVDCGTVTKALGPVFKGRRQGRDRKPLEVDGKRYESQAEVFVIFRVRKAGLRKLIESGRAKYV